MTPLPRPPPTTIRSPPDRCTSSPPGPLDLHQTSTVLAAGLSDLLQTGVLVQPQGRRISTRPVLVHAQGHRLSTRPVLVNHQDFRDLYQTCTSSAAGLSDLHQTCTSSQQTSVLLRPLFYTPLSSPSPCAMIKHSLRPYVSDRSFSRSPFTLSFTLSIVK